MAERNSAIHAAPALALQLVLGQRLGEFAVMGQALGDRRVSAVAALEIEEACRLAHQRVSF
ncbi:MAG: hypothetical protein WDN69_21950 [Aliidongia sp.]